MPNPNDEALKTKQQQLGQQIEQKKQELANAPDDQKAAIQKQITELEGQMRGVHDQQKDFRQQNRQGGQGAGRANSPGRVKG